MPVLTRLAISGLRNIAEANLEPEAGFNLFFGNNGSGKTSLLEALYLLGMGRSFRSHLQKPLISHEMPAATVFGETLDGITIGIQRPQRGLQSIKIAGKPAEGIAELSRTLPVQLINSDTFQLMEGSPSDRRHFLDWGVFHVEHQYLEYWRRAKKALEQRNLLLRAEASANEIEPWSHELALNAGHMDEYRRSYIDQLAVQFAETVSTLELPASLAVSFNYSRGWDSHTDLFVQLQESLSKDRKYGHTTAGPHKADLQFKVGGLDAAEVLSRGQLKLLICALKVVQSQHLINQRGIRCLFLLDDLPAELDVSNREMVCKLLGSLKTQVFMTSIELEALAPVAIRQAEANSMKTKMFHVKHGIICSI